MTNPSQLKQEILRLVGEYSKAVHTNYRPANDPLRADWDIHSAIPYAGRVFSEDEVQAAVSSTLDFWLTLGTSGNAFQEELEAYLGAKKCLLVNSGSSANLVAISALTSSKISKNRRLLPSDEVITVSAGFPTTVAPIIQVGAVPVFLDVSPVTGNIISENLESAYVHGKTKAVILAHALGNPFDLASILKFCRKYDLWLIEDNCDSLGSTYSMPESLARELGFDSSSPGLDVKPGFISRWSGTWGDISTQSFYPPHHLTMGEGGSVNIISDKKLSVICESFRDWGRDCWCPSGVDNTCNKRFDWQLGDLPAGYDHKYIYSHLGYNLKPLDPQAAIGRVQLNRLDSFIQMRKYNWQYLRSGLDSLSEFLEFTLPTHAKKWNPDGSYEWDDSGCHVDCSWFGFKIEVKQHSVFNRSELSKHLDNHKIGHRMFFGGNLVKQPAFTEILKTNKNAYRVVGLHKGADQIMNNQLFLGTYPGLTKEMLDHEIHVIKEFFTND